MTKAQTNFLENILLSYKAIYVSVIEQEEFKKDENLGFSFPPLELRYHQSVVSH